MMSIAIEVSIAVRELERGGHDVKKSEIATFIAREFGDRRPGVSTHISEHCLATAEANPGDHRYLIRTRPGYYRSFQEGDPYHPSRARGRTRPELDRVPPRYRHLFE